MAPIATTVALSHVEGVSDAARARELYKYYQPNAPPSSKQSSPVPPSTPDQDATPQERKLTSSVTSSKISSPDTALTAFCQLVTWRLETQRAMISVIDGATQYFIAESTKTVDFLDNTKHAPGDEIWTRTIEVVPTEKGYPSFIVNDLTKDERFNELPFVKGSPFMRFYAGVPLITKRGIPIGSLFIVDSRVRDGLKEDEIHFMGAMAKTIMKHLEIVREVEEHRRGMKMSRGLASFVEGRTELAEADTDAEEEEGTKIVGQFETDTTISRSKSKSSSIAGSVRSGTSAASVERKEKEYSNALLKTEEAIISGHEKLVSSSTPPDLGAESQRASLGATSMTVSSQNADLLDKGSLSTPDDEISSMKILFSRAANLIREAFEVDGGAVFYDAQKGSSSDYGRKPQPSHELSREDSQTSGDEFQSLNDSISEADEVKDPPTSPELSPTTKASHSPQEASFSHSANKSSKPVEILGFSTPEASSIHGDEQPGTHSFIPFDEKSLNTLLRRYPRGKLWTFDSDGTVSSSDEENLMHRGTPTQYDKEISRRILRNSRNESTGKFILRHFPGVRQLLFVPLWDAARSRWLSGCCAWSTEPTRILSKQGELAFLSAFGNSVMAECSRMDTEIANQKKGDFIGSISHELRSPLHGILASAEFLGEEVSTAFEKGLVETIDSCGRTLLDTINHVLDFSKINNFERSWRKKNRGGTRTAPRTRSGPLALRQADLPMINLFAEVDISVVCEEVVEGVFAGSVFQNFTAQTFDMVPDAHEKMSRRKDYGSSSIPVMGPESLQHPEVAVILDIDLQDYQFTTQPGAFRRVIMNLLGNALKYTSHGYVQITLEVTEMEALQTSPGSEKIARSMVVLTIADTGRGISSEFLRSKLFTPFAQENSLSSGTGLGLSIVRSIVALLEGDITIDSEPGKGTCVKVTLPLLREMPKTTSSSGTPKSSISMPRETDETISLVRARVLGQKVSLYGFEIDSKDPIIPRMGQLLKSSIIKFLVNWYGMQVVPIGQKSSIIVANEANPVALGRLARTVSSQRPAPSILVLCSHSSRFDRTQTGSNGNFSFVAKPVGPLKLARALMQCLDGASKSTTPRLLSEITTESTDLSNVFEELSPALHGGEVLDNSRMSADSDNARKAIESPTPNAVAEKAKEFPFPIDARSVASTAATSPSEQGKVSFSSTKPSKRSSLSISPKDKSSQPLNVSPSASPRLLLVDDNKINLTLLRTYMRKRKYDVIDEAENGLEAVKKFEEREEGYDIIFMDISMPVLDGFDATRQIRAIEESRRKKAEAKAANTPEVNIGHREEIKRKPLPLSVAKVESPIEGPRTPALVIALTGLASSRDQSEAFTSGIDLFLTKPVAFKEVGKMLDNWQANREKDAR
ncbi:hypothetical protein B7494_g7570 [Chlorociboria aeruginascens]|nr:hypothetical protein B7494_g7570 [Chlorociboria aeruginascens]